MGNCYYISIAGIAFASRSHGTIRVLYMEASLSYLPYNSKIKCFAVYSETQLSWLLEPALNCTQKTQRKLSAPSKRTDGKLGAGAEGTGGGEVTQKSMKRAIMNVPFRSMGPSWGLLWFLLRKNTFPDHRLQKSIETKKKYPSVPHFLRLEEMPLYVIHFSSCPDCDRINQQTDTLL